MDKPISEVIRDRIVESGDRYWAGDNISKHIKEGEKELLIDELAAIYESSLKALLIDTTNDPNSKGTGRRMAKMQINEILSGRYNEAPDATAFPNDNEQTRYDGMLVAQASINSICSHHFAQVFGTAYIGIIPGNKVIGLSKYTRIAQWCARRGTLQEELCNDITREIQAASGSDDVGVYLKLRHNCCETRGVMSSDSTTQTTVLRGAFRTDVGTKAEFFDNIRIQEMSKRK